MLVFAGSGIEPFALPPHVLPHQHGPQLGKTVRRVVHRGQDDRPLIDRRRKRPYFVAQSTLQPIR